MDKPYAIRNKETGKLLDIDGATWLPKEAIVEYYDTFVDHSKCEIVTIYVAPIEPCEWCEIYSQEMKLLTIEDALPCPFCGSAKVHFVIQESPWEGSDRSTRFDADVSCPECPFEIAMEFWSEGCAEAMDHVVRAWNRRTP